MFNRIKKKIHILHSIYIKHQYLKKKKTYSMDGEDLVISNYFKDKKKASILMLGVIIPFIGIILFCYIKKAGEE